MTRNTLMFALKLVVSISIFAALFVMFDLAEVWSRLKIHSFSYLGLALCGFLALLVSNAFRWWVILCAIRIDLPFAFTLKLQYIAAFFNQALPSVIGGDAIRMYLLQATGTPLQKSVNSVVIERMVALAGLIFLVTGLQPFVLAHVDLGPAQYVFPALSAIAISGIVTVMLLDKLPVRIRHWRAVTFFSVMATDAKSVFLSLKYGVFTMALSLFSSTLMAVIALFGARALGIELATMDALVLIPPAILASTLPISIAGWGVREGAMVATLTYAGVSEVDALVVSIMFGFTMVVSSMPGGLLWLASKSRRPS
ncbi:MAG: flippase-like domain-containing protein [Rhodospirillales bacterium]|nr:flippase-like domain-containing protein [Rhodospirillales bacterium]MBT4038998.1 flippase-like domain-containing protein [Rhodospirillales bacterium]MBT4628168.1 flippase-like domain-containing protein [Rhodospirillales bacterium]MBT5522146.1 flippase-like domain-containing protein [Rhodospirillales bacterium]MBT6110741.1 flippase-like domain-containing protein [Rhodospirillales bacterium]